MDVPFTKFEIEIVRAVSDLGALSGRSRTCGHGRAQDQGDGHQAWKFHGLPPFQILGPNFCAASASSMGMISFFQLVSQVLPPSAEKACSQLATAFEPLGCTVQVKRTMMGLPSKVSGASNTPTFPTNLPTTGASITPPEK